MNSLILDCSSGMNIYLIKGEEVFEFVDQNQKRHTDELLLTVDKLIKDAKLSVNEINNICVCVGPGSFTGIRVAISICKGLAVTNDVKIFCASNFDIFSVDSKKYYLLLDGFSDFVYARQYLDGKVLDKCIKIEELISKLKNDNFEIFVGSEKMQNLLKSYEISSNIAKNDTIMCFKKKILNDDETLINEISPIYLRASQAEIERENKLKK